MKGVIFRYCVFELSGEPLSVMIGMNAFNFFVPEETPLCFKNVTSSHRMQFQVKSFNSTPMAMSMGRAKCL